MYGNTAGKNTEGLSIPSLGPGLYSNYSLKEVKAEKTTKGDGTEGKNIITFLFDGPQGPHQHTEYEVETSDVKFQSKSENLSKRVTHIMSKFIPRAQADAVSGNTFEEYARNVANTLNVNVISQVKDLDIKVTGQVYNGKATAGFPGYPPFVARKSSTDFKPLSLTDRERRDNEAYNNFLSASPDNDTTSSTSSSSPSGSPIDSDF